MGLLIDNEPDALVELLLKPFNMIDPLTRKALIGSLPPALQQSVSLSASPRNDIRLLVDVAEGDGARLSDGRWPIELVIRRAISDNEGLQLAVDLKALLDAALARPPVAPAAAAALFSPAAPLDPYLTCIVLDQKPFVNRRAFRSHLQAMAKRDASALIVEGEPFTGKSYSYQLIKYLWKQEAIPPPTFINVANMPRDDYTIKMIVSSLAKLAGENADELLKQYDINSIDRWIFDVGDWLTVRANERATRVGKSWWIVLDNIAPRLKPSQPDPAPHVTDMLNRLVRQMVARCYETIHLRVVLLGYKQIEIAGLEQNIVDEVRVDHLSETIEHTELKAFFEKYFQSLNRADRLAEVDALLTELAVAAGGDIQSAPKLWLALPEFFRNRGL